MPEPEPGAGAGAGYYKIMNIDLINKNLQRGTFVYTQQGHRLAFPRGVSGEEEAGAGDDPARGEHLRVGLLQHAPFVRLVTQPHVLRLRPPELRTWCIDTTLSSLSPRGKGS